MFNPAEKARDENARTALQAHEEWKKIITASDERILKYEEEENKKRKADKIKEMEEQLAMKNKMAENLRKEVEKTKKQLKKEQEAENRLEKKSKNNKQKESIKNNKDLTIPELVTEINEAIQHLAHLETKLQSNIADLTSNDLAGKREKKKIIFLKKF